MPSQLHLLIVDDNAVLLKLLSHTLGEEYQITIFSGGLEAIDWLKQGNKTDLIITDLSMPLFDGFKLIEEVRANKFYNHIPIIVLSATEESQTRIHCLEIGADDYITKPFNPIEVKVKVGTILRRVQRTQQNLAS